MTLRFILPVILVALIPLITACQNNVIIEKNKNTQHTLIIPNSEIIHLKSKQIGEYKITVSWPSQAAPKEGYPVLYLLDGDSYFLPAHSILSEQSCERCAIQNGIVVAIDYIGKSRRARDYLYQPETLTLEILPDKTVNFPEAYGGADQFYDFIEHELKPEIEKRFTINKKQQTIFGHSYGGLYVLYSFITHRHTFTNYIASSPSIWFSGGDIINLLNQYVKTHHSLTNPINLTISVGGNEQSLTANEKTLTQVEQNKLLLHRQNRKMVDNSKAFYQILNQTKLDKLSLNYSIYPNQTHQTAPIIALQDGIQIGFGRH